MAIKLPFLSDDHHFAIANVAARSAEMDQTIDRMVYLTIQPDTVAEFLVKNVPTDRLVEILRLALVTELTKWSSNIDDLFSRIKSARTNRNHVLHWLHESTDKPEVVRFTDRRGGRKQEPKDYTASDIQKIASVMADACDELLEWWNLYNWHYELRGKPSPPTRPPHWALPRKLRPPNKPRPHGPPSRKRPT